MFAVWLALAGAQVPTPSPPPAPSPSESAESAPEAPQKGAAGVQSSNAPGAPDPQGLAEAAARRGDLEEAERFARQAVKAQPEDARAHAFLGSVLLRQQRYDEAETSLARAVSLDPQLLDARYNLAYAQRSTRNLAAAAANYRKVLELVPDDADAWYALAETYAELDAPKDAAGAFERYVELEDRPDRQRWVERARQRAAQLRVSAAAPAPSTTDSRQATPAPAPSNPGLLHAVEALKSGAFQEALRILTKEVGEPNSPLEWAAYGSANLGLGRAEDAERQYRTALRTLGLTSAGTPGLRFGLAEALRLQGQDASALYQQVVQSKDPAFSDLARQRLDLPPDGPDAQAAP